MREYYESRLLRLLVLKERFGLTDIDNLIDFNARKLLTDGD